MHTQPHPCTHAACGQRRLTAQTRSRSPSRACPTSSPLPLGATLSRSTTATTRCGRGGGVACCGMVWCVVGWCGVVCGQCTQHALTGACVPAAPAPPATAAPPPPPPHTKHTHPHHKSRQCTTTRAAHTPHTARAGRVGGRGPAAAHHAGQPRHGAQLGHGAHRHRRAHRHQSAAQPAQVDGLLPRAHHARTAGALPLRAWACACVRVRAAAAARVCVVLVGRHAAAAARTCTPAGHAHTVACVCCQHTPLSRLPPPPPPPPPPHTRPTLQGTEFAQANRQDLAGTFKYLEFCLEQVRGSGGRPAGHGLCARAPRGAGDDKRTRRRPPR
jgi:hypothetical protein